MAGRWVIAQHSVCNQEKHRCLDSCMGWEMRIDWVLVRIIPDSSEYWQHTLNNYLHCKLELKNSWVFLLRS